jgi:hypothetical protein
MAMAGTSGMEGKVDEWKAETDMAGMEVIRAVAG